MSKRLEALKEKRKQIDLEIASLEGDAQRQEMVSHIENEERGALGNKSMAKYDNNQLLTLVVAETLRQNISQKLLYNLWVAKGNIANLNCYGRNFQNISDGELASTSLEWGIKGKSGQIETRPLYKIIEQCKQKLNEVCAKNQARATEQDRRGDEVRHRAMKHDNVVMNHRG